jgi:16S rRNA (adenine1518-N6/adenine1519-N6)-dimethyltransferase
MSKVYHLIASPPCPRQSGSMPSQHDGRARRGPPALPARRKWGQHFLARPETAERIVDAARVEPNDSVLEIGPGDGALTRPLSRRAARVVAVEIDPLRAQFLERELGGDRVVILRGDALSRPPGDWLREGGVAGGGVLVANLPYNVATPIVQAAVEDPAIRRSVVTVQREVARRLVARPGDDAYGYLSVRTSARADARILFDLPPGAFRPAPKVTSSVVALAPRAEPLAAEERDAALRLASLGFGARRKTLANALSRLAPKAEWERALEALGFDARVRAEELSLENFLALAHALPLAREVQIPSRER